MILAHGGHITGDETALIVGGLLVAMAFPAAALLIGKRRARSRRTDESVLGSVTLQGELPPPADKRS